MAAVTHAWHLCHLTWITFPLETLACSFFCFLTTSLASSYVTLCLKMLERDALSWHKSHTIYFLLAEAWHSKGLQLSIKHPPDLDRLCLCCLPEMHCTAACLCSETNFTRGKGTFMGLTQSSSGCTGNFEGPLSWLEKPCKLCFIFWEVSWSDKSPAGHFFSAHPVPRCCCCLGLSLEILGTSLRE